MRAQSLSLSAATSQDITKIHNIARHTKMIGNTLKLLGITVGITGIASPPIIVGVAGTFIVISYIFESIQTRTKLVLFIGDVLSVLNDIAQNLVIMEKLRFFENDVHNVNVFQEKLTHYIQSLFKFVISLVDTDNLKQIQTVFDGQELFKDNKLLKDMLEIEIGYRGQGYRGKFSYMLRNMAGIDVANRAYGMKLLNGTKFMTIITSKLSLIVYWYHRLYSEFMFRMLTGDIDKNEYNNLRQKNVIIEQDTSDWKKIYKGAQLNTSTLPTVDLAPEEMKFAENPMIQRDEPDESAPLINKHESDTSKPKPNNFFPSIFGGGHTYKNRHKRRVRNHTLRRHR
jgi:hypothetical protein